MWWWINCTYDIKAKINSNRGKIFMYIKQMKKKHYVTTKAPAGFELGLHESQAQHFIQSANE